MDGFELGAGGGAGRHRHQGVVHPGSPDAAQHGLEPGRALGMAPTRIVGGAVWVCFEEDCGSRH